MCARKDHDEHARELAQANAGPCDFASQRALHSSLPRLGVAVAALLPRMLLSVQPVTNCISSYPSCSYALEETAGNVVL